MEPKKHHFAKREGLLIAAVLCLVLLLYLLQGMLYQGPAAAVEISIVGENSQKIVLETFDLYENREYTIQTEPEGINHLVIEDGTARITSANCPNHDCVRQGTISQNGEMLVCIPHRLTVSILGN